MRKAALYARVSSALQEKERTIESQLEELKKQIAKNGDVLTKEYIDDGFSGKFLDRPAMNQLRSDLKTNLFDSVYFLQEDRVARKTAHQNLIIGEILKYNKQLVLRGKDYVHNPENEFTLTVLGAVAQLEREKILERYTRGRMHKLRKGQPMANGRNTYGYTYIPRGTDPARFEILEKEAPVVKKIFKLYGEDQASQSTLLRYLEDHNIPTRNGTTWDHTKLTNTLKNTAYMGIKYFNKASLVKEPSDPIRKIKYGKLKYRDKSEWLPVKVPAIVSKELFDKVQKRLQESKQAYRKPKKTQLLSGLVKCGQCGWSYSPYKRFYRGYKYKDGKAIKRYGIYHKVAYTCSRRIKQKAHSKTAKIVRCTNPEIIAHRLEDCVFSLVKEVMTDPAKLTSHLIDLKPHTEKSAAKEKMQKQLKILDEKLSELAREEEKLLDRYAGGNITRQEYAKQSQERDEAIKKIKVGRIELTKKLPSLHEDNIIETSIKRHCENVKSEFAKSNNFENKREFLQKYIDRIIFNNGTVQLTGLIPILLKTYGDPSQTSEASKIEFVIETKINKIRLV